MNFDDRLEALRRKGCHVPDHSQIKTPEQVAGIRESGKINTGILDYVAEHIREGISTEEIDRWVYDITVKHGAVPAPLNFEGFP